MDEEKKLEIAAQFKRLAELNFQNQNLSDACFYYINCLKVLPEWKDELKKRFIIVLSCLGQVLEKQQQFTEIFTLYEEALMLYDCEEIHHNLGAHLLRLGCPDKAVFYFKEALERNKNYFPAYRSLHSTYCALIERWHYRMLNDSYRNEAYKEAIFKKVQQGFNTVLDIGTGTGLFCLYALEAGAKNIYGCDCNPVMLSIAARVLAENFIDDKIKLIDKHSNSITIPEDMPERVSLVVTETMDSCMLGEHMLQTLRYVWEYLLSPPYHFADDESILNRSGSGIVIPHCGSLWFSAVQSKLLARKYVFPMTDEDTEECANALANISLRDSPAENFQNVHFKDIELFAGLNDPYDTERLQSFADCVFLTEPQELFSINFNDPRHIEKCLFSDNRCSLEITCSRDGYLHAIAAWFRVQLDDDIVLCSAPDGPNSKNCCWDQAIFPSQKSYRVMPGSKISLFSDWTDGKVTFRIHQVTHPDQPVPHKPLPRKAPPNFLAMLNDAKLLEHLKHSAVNFVEQFRGQRSLRMMDLFPVPIFGLIVLRNVHLINSVLAEVKLVCVVQSEEDAEVIKGIAACNQVPLSQISFILVDDFDEQITRTSSQFFDAIMMNFLDGEGDLNEDAICHVNTLRSILKPEGLLLPKRLEVCAQLIHSDYIEENMRVVNGDIYRYGIGAAINEFQVFQMVEMNIALLKFEKYSSTFICHQFLPADFDDEFFKEFTTTIARQGTVNSILYWYNVSFFDEQRYYSTLHEFSYVHQAAFHTAYPHAFEENENVIIRFVYHHGAFLINLQNK